MSEPKNFFDLPLEDQARIRNAGRETAALTFRYVTPVFVAPPASTNPVIRHGSGILIELGGHFFLLTAWHLITEWRLLVDQDPTYQFHLVGPESNVAFNPDSRIEIFDDAADVVLLRLTGEEAIVPRTIVYRPAREWPPIAPAIGEYVFVGGYPALLRSNPTPRYWDFAYFSAGTSVTGASLSRFSLHFERENWVTWQGGPPTHDVKSLGGMSGGPVFAQRGLLVELVGVVSEHSESLDTMTCAVLSQLRP